MENLRRHFAYAGQTGKVGADRSSVFHLDVKHEQEHISSPIASGGMEVMSNSGPDSLTQTLNVFVQCLSRYHGAGTQFREQLSNTLKGTLYEPLGAMCTTKLTPNLFDRHPDLLQIVNELHTALRGINENQLKTEASQQAVLKCMLLLLKLEALYHEMYLKEVQTGIGELSRACVNHNCHDVLNLIRNLGLVNHLNALNGQNNSNGQCAGHDTEKATSASHGSHGNLLSVKDNSRSSAEEPPPSKLAPKQTSKSSSIFNIFARKNSPEESKNNSSSFYVDIASENRSGSSNSRLQVDPGNRLSLSVTPPPSTDRKSQSSLPLIPEQCKSAPSKNKGSRSGQMATEEEIDSVINLLSGCGYSSGSNCSSRTSPQMQSIPENKISTPRLELPRDHLSVPPPAARASSPGATTAGCPVVTNIPITVTHETDSLKLPPRTQLHRRSEGSIDFSNGTVTDQNTWPHHNRGLGHSGFNHAFYDPLAHEQLYGRRFSSELQNRSRGYYANNFMSNPHWLFPDSKLNPAWQTMSSHTSSQTSGLATAGSDTMASSWSGFQDSSDLSDDDSSGEQFFAVGLDLVNALDSKNDSSDDECDKSDHGGQDQRPRSMESLMDVKATHTWPPKQPWARSALVISEAMEAAMAENHHRPLQMQWSDPMSSRNVWGAAGLGPQLSHRSMHDFGPLPH